MKLNGLRDNLYVALVLQLAVVMLLFSVCRVIFYVHNIDMFPDVTARQLVRIMYGGLLFDLSAVCYINFVYLQLYLLPFRFRYHVAFQRGMRIWFIVTNALAIAFNAMDWVYYRYTLKRATAELFVEFSNEQSLASLVMSLIAEFWQVAVVWLVLVGLLIYACTRIRMPSQPALQGVGAFYGTGTLMFVAGTALIVIGCRGGFFARSHRPITNSNAGQYVDVPEHMALVTNTPFSIIRTFDKKPLRRQRFYASEEALSSVYTPVHRGLEGASPKRLNVVLFILESFGSNAIGALNTQLNNGAYRGFTPFVDDLMTRSLVFPNCFANGHKSIDALPSITASIPELKQHYVLSHYYHNQIHSIAELLKRKGYQTSFFHGAPNGSMGFEAFAKMAGFERFYGLDEYGDASDYDGAWGIWDEEFFQFFAERLNQQQQPFLSTIFSLSSHSPFDVPARYEGKFRKGPRPIDECIGYTDYALRRFFEKAATMPWYENTLFVITADHGGAMSHREYQTSTGRLRVPLIFFQPSNQQLRGWDERIVQQIDIMPTVLRYLGFDEDFVAFGNDVFGPQTEHFAISFTDGVYQLIRGDYVLQLNQKKLLALYDHKTDRLLKTNLLDAHPDIAAPMERLTKAVIQQYNNRMLDDRLTVR